MIKTASKTSAKGISSCLKFPLLLIFIFFLVVQTSTAEKLYFTAGDASNEEIATQTFHVDGYRRIYALIPADKYDFARIELKLTLENVSGNAFFVTDSRYTQQTEIKNELIFYQQPSEFDKRRIELQLNGKGQLRIERAEIVKIVPEYRFDGEKYNVYLFIHSADANQGFKGGMKVFSKKSFSTLGYTIKLSYFGWEIFRDSKSLTSKSKFAKGKLSNIGLNIPARFFILPGTYTLEISSNEWKFSKSLTIWPSISTAVAFVLVASTVFAGVRYRQEIGEWIGSLSIGQKLVLVAIILLIFAALTLAFENEKNANSISILAYYFLVLGVGNLTAEYLLERRTGSEEDSNWSGSETEKENGWVRKKEKENGENAETFDPYPEARAIISLLILAILVHLTPELLRTLPYLDIAALISALFLIALSVRDRLPRKI
ncbi:MAG: hypothetical protein H0Z28_12470 [Archaeoglobus sp.]|nr:hypothetical protein [Archaeoglobus sp.]